MVRKLLFGAGTILLLQLLIKKTCWEDTILDRDYVNFFPGRILYINSIKLKIVFVYNGSTQQLPSHKFSPVADNTTRFSKPLVILIWATVYHNFNFTANSFKCLASADFLCMKCNCHHTRFDQSKNYPGGITTLTLCKYQRNIMPMQDWTIQKIYERDFNLNWGLNFNGSRYSNLWMVKKHTDNNAPGLSWDSIRKRKKV